MKKKNSIIVKLIVSALVIITPGIFILDSRDPYTPESRFTERSGTAILITGAAARIPQEAALLEELDRRGLLKDVVFISGVSSGALNSLALNGILSGKMTWEEYRKILFSVSDTNIFIQDRRRLPVNTDPERELLEYIAEDKLGYKTIGDLPFMTEISITNLKGLKKRVYRMCSRKINEETDTTLSIVDILMASTAFPIAFPDIRIRNVKTIPDVSYSDGAFGDDHVPFYGLLEFEKFRGTGVAKVYIISRKSDSIPAVSEELKALGINDKDVFDKLGISMDNILKKGIIKRLKAFKEVAPDLVPLTYVYIPDFSENFLMFNFGHLERQYTLTLEWAKKHDPVPLETFLKPYYHELKTEFE